MKGCGFLVFLRESHPGAASARRCTAAITVNRSRAVAAPPPARSSILMQISTTFPLLQKIRLSFKSSLLQQCRNVLRSTGEKQEENVALFVVTFYWKGVVYIAQWGFSDYIDNEAKRQRKKLHVIEKSQKLS